MNATGEDKGEEFFDEEDLTTEALEDEMQGPEALKKLREKLKKEVDQSREYLDSWQRSRADLANFKRDELHRSTSQEIRSKVDFAEAVIPALDSFEMALGDKGFQASDENFKKGIEAVYSNLLKSLERLGIERFDPKGEKFNPHQHEALREVPTDNTEQDHTIESVHRAGFKVEGSDGEDRIIRPAQVSVYSHSN